MAGMDHPIFNRTRFLVYVSGWATVGIIQFIIMLFTGFVPVLNAAVDALVSMSWFAVIGFSLWYYVRQLWTLRDKMKRWRIVSMQVVAMMVVLTVWVGGVYTVLSIVFADNVKYLEFVEVILPWRLGSGMLLYLLVSMTYVLFLLDSERTERLKVEARLREMLKESELNLIKSQINPHFLFNSLNSASLLTLTAPDKAREMIIALSEYLRYSISGRHDTMANLGAELENVQRYLEIEKIRFGDKLQLEFHLPEHSLSFPVPAMLLQPLYENAIKHGVYEATGQVRIATVVRISSEALDIEIANTHESGTSSRKGSGLGLRSVRERLQMLYGDKAWMQVQAQEGLFTVKLSIPRNP